jgi:hypothetical protein
MKKTDQLEKDILSVYEKGELKFKHVHLKKACLIRH